MNTKPFVFRTILYDSQQIKAREQHFFQDKGNKEEKSAKDLYSEGEIVKWLFENVSSFPQLFYEELKITGQYFMHFNQTVPFTEKNRKPGDIDMLLHSKQSPEQTIVIECKKIKAKIDHDGNFTLNKLGTLRSGVAQSNALQKLGFSETYLMLIIVTDGRDKNDGYAFRGLDRKGLNEIFISVDSKDLSEDIGILIVEVIQVSGRPIEETACIQICNCRIAKNKNQLAEITNKLIEHRY